MENERPDTYYFISVKGMEQKQTSRDQAYRDRIFLSYDIANGSKKKPCIKMDS